MSSGPRVYISAPVTGRDLNERKAYFAVRASALRARGCQPVNPLEGEGCGRTWEEAMLQDLNLLAACQAVEFNPGWERSRGCRLELLVARLLGLEVWDTLGQPLNPIDQREALVALIHEIYVPGGDILEEAQRLVYWHRSQAYDHPARNFARIAAGWNVILEGKLRQPITPDEVGLMEAWVKIARQIYQRKRDNMVDLAGYAATVQMVLDGDG